jgi:putative oxygen-independent coproporphyrinogen III oxidase
MLGRGLYGLYLPMTADQRQLGVYLHWPYCAVICPYCDFNVYRARTTDPEPLLAAILKDLTYWREQTGPRQLFSLFFGGGTPSLLSPAQVTRVIETCDTLWGFAPGAEISLEANPTDAETNRFADLAIAGVNRLSLGIQSFDDDLLKFLGRNHDGPAAYRAAGVARHHFPRVSFDFIYGLPDQTEKQWIVELLCMIEDFGPDHISPYQLTIEKGTAFARAVGRGAWTPISQDQGADFFEATNTALSVKGYEAYEVSNHAISPETRSTHNQLYWRSQDWIGVGPGAHGRLGQGATRRATLAAARPTDYITAIKDHGTGAIEDVEIGLEAAREEYWMMGLRLLEGVPMADAPGAPLDGGRLTSLIDAEFLTSINGRIALAKDGVPVADAVIRNLLL